jgi:hypothetical protein
MTATITYTDGRTLPARALPVISQRAGGNMSNGVVTVAVDEFLMVVDGSGVVVQCIRQAQELVGCTAEEVAGQPVAHLVTGVAAGVRRDARPGRAGVLLPGGDGHAVRLAGAAHAAPGRRCGMGCLPGSAGRGRDC